MASKALIPRNRSGEALRQSPTHDSPFLALQQEMNRLFDSFFRSWSGTSPAALLDRPLGSFAPRVDVTETEKTIEVDADMPGLNEKDIEVTLSNAGHALNLRGEKRVEREQKERGYHHLERAFGSFQRTVTLPCAVAENKIEATFKNGVLHVSLPKQAAQSQSARRIPIKTP